MVPEPILVLGKGLQSRCWQTHRHTAICEQDIVAPYQNLCNTKGKAVAESEKMGSPRSQEELAATVNKLVEDMTSHEEAISRAYESFSRLNDVTASLQEQVNLLMG